MNIYKAFGFRKHQAHTDPSRTRGEAHEKLSRAEHKRLHYDESKIAEKIAEKARKSPTFAEAQQALDIDAMKRSWLKNPYEPEPKRRPTLHLPAMDEAIGEMEWIRPKNIGQEITERQPKKRSSKFDEKLLKIFNIRKMPPHWLGEIDPQHGMTMGECEKGKCTSNAYDFAMKNQDLNPHIVHGSNMFLEGGHAWVEVDHPKHGKLVFDPSSNLAGSPKDMYEDMGRDHTVGNALQPHMSFRDEWPMYVPEYRYPLDEYHKVSLDADTKFPDHPDYKIPDDEKHFLHPGGEKAIWDSIRQWGHGAKKDDHPGYAPIDKMLWKTFGIKKQDLISQFQDTIGSHYKDMQRKNKELYWHMEAARQGEMEHDAVIKHFHREYTDMRNHFNRLSEIKNQIPNEHLNEETIDTFNQLEYMLNTVWSERGGSMTQHPNYRGANLLEMKPFETSEWLATNSPDRIDEDPRFKTPLDKMLMKAKKHPLRDNRRKRLSRKARRLLNRLRYGKGDVQMGSRLYQAMLDQFTDEGRVTDTAEELLGRKPRASDKTTPAEKPRYPHTDSSHKKRDQAAQNAVREGNIEDYPWKIMPDDTIIDAETGRIIQPVATGREPTVKPPPQAHFDDVRRTNPDYADITGYGTGSGQFTQRGLGREATHPPKLGIPQRNWNAFEPHERDWALQAYNEGMRGVDILDTIHHNRRLGGNPQMESHLQDRASKNLQMLYKAFGIRKAENGMEEQESDLPPKETLRDPYTEHKFDQFNYQDTGMDRLEAVQTGMCAKCGGKAGNYKTGEGFEDETSRREYGIIGFCQKCQNDFYGSLPDENEE